MAYFEQENNNNKRLNILFLTARLPYPVIGGDRLKPFNIISHLAKSHNVSLVAFYQGNNVPDAYLEGIKQIGVEPYVIPLNPINQALRSLPKIFGKDPLEILYYSHPEYKKTVDKLLSERNYSLAFAFFMRTAEYLKDKPLKKILMAEDCRTLYQKRSYQESSNLVQRGVRWWEYHKLKNYEPEIVNHFDITTLVTNNDIQSMKSSNPNADYRLLTNGTDIHKFVPPENSHQRKGILFAGKLDVWANVLMIQNIIKNILPYIKESVPDAELHIAGANPSSSILNLASDSIKIFPDVPDMKPFLQNAQLFLHPHTGGSGIQNKLLEAMACGCPVVTTPTGNQGIDAKDGIEAMIGKDSKELTDKSVLLLKDKELARLIGNKGRELILRTHSWESVFNVLDNLVKELT